VKNAPYKKTTHTSTGERKGKEFITMREFLNKFTGRGFIVPPPSGRWKEIGYRGWSDKGKGFDILLDGNLHYVPYFKKLPILHGMVAITTEDGITIIHDYYKFQRRKNEK